MYNTNNSTSSIPYSRPVRVLSYGVVRRSLPRYSMTALRLRCADGHYTLNNRVLCNDISSARWARLDVRPCECREVEIDQRKGQSTYRLLKTLVCFGHSFTQGWHSHSTKIIFWIWPQSFLENEAFSLLGSEWTISHSSVHSAPACLSDILHCFQQLSLCVNADCWIL